MTCPKCGQSNPRGADNCAACGTSLAATSDPGSRTEIPTLAPGAATTRDSGGASLTQFSPGARLGSRYEIVSMLGKGGMGAVYKALDLELKRTVALKLIKPEMSSRPEILERFKREILLSSQVTHKNVLRIHDLGEAGDIKFISMQYVEGTDLRTLLQKEGPLPAEKAVPLLRQIAEALQAAHDAGIVHRDLKPPNILLDADGNAYIADFGISRSLDTGSTMTETGMIIGTIDYMSPEQARGEVPDHRSDIYSLGMMMYEVLTGTLPFQSGGNTLSVLMKRVHEDAPAVRKTRPEVPPWLSAIISRAMQRDPAARYQSVAEIVRDLDRQKAAVDWRRLATIRVAAAAGVVLVLAALGFYFLRPKTAVVAAPAVSLAVFPFQNGTGDPRYDWVRTGLPDLLNSDLIQAKGLRMAGQERLREILDSLKLGAGEESRPAQVQRIASLLGAENVVTASLMKAGEQYRIEANILRVGPATATAGKPISLTGTGEESIFSMVDELTRRVRDELGVSKRMGETDKGTMELSTRSVEALRLYSEGLALSRKGNHLEAGRRLEAALEKDPDFAVARALLAETYDGLGYSDRAAKEAERAAQGLKDASTYESERIRAVRARLTNDLSAARDAYKRLSEIAPNSADALLDLAAVQEDKGELDEALVSLRRTVKLDPKHPDAHYALGRILVKLGNSTEALEEFNTALGLHAEAGNEEGRATVLNGIGSAYLYLSRYDEALKNFQASLELRRKIGDKRGVHVALTNVAMILSIGGKYEEALSDGDEALRIATEIGDRKGQANLYSKLGDIYQQAGRAEEALASYQESLKIAREIGDDAGLAQTFSSIGYIDHVLGRYVEAFFFQKEGLEKRRQIGDKWAILSSLIDIGVVESVQGRYDEAIKYYLEGLSLSREIGEKQSEVVIKSNLSIIQEDQGQYAAALSGLSEAETIAREIGDKTMIATTLMYIGSTRNHLGDVQGADKAIEEAVRLTRELGNEALLAETLIQSGRLLLSRSDPARAGEVLREAVGLAQKTKDKRL
ncbi:MAG TPA: tetratricopeptide repeat protein, partial [Candidatus Polarisedimenticolia bacterium]|nr:tetratricopeptide repeat protein [Candidatus Polarisedimenticolia bacterium]